MVKYVHEKNLLKARTKQVSNYIKGDKKDELKDSLTILFL